MIEFLKLSSATQGDVSKMAFSQFDSNSKILWTAKKIVTVKNTIILPAFKTLSDTGVRSTGLRARVPGSNPAFYTYGLECQFFRVLYNRLPVVGD